MALLSMSLNGCSLFVPWGVFYRGPGRYEKLNGVWRVVVGTVSLGSQDRAVATFSHLGPHWSWAVVFRIKPLPVANHRPNPLVRLTLQNEKGQLVFDHGGRLAKWDWSGDRVAVKGQTREVPLKGGGVEITAIGVGIDGGWGSYFTPRYGGTYTLTCEVLDGDGEVDAFHADISLETYLGSL